MFGLPVNLLIDGGFFAAGVVFHAAASAFWTKFISPKVAAVEAVVSAAEAAAKAAEAPATPAK